MADNAVPEQWGGRCQADNASPEGWGGRCQADNAVPGAWGGRCAADNAVPDQWGGRCEDDNAFPVRPHFVLNPHHVFAHSLRMAKVSRLLESGPFLCWTQSN